MIISLVLLSGGVWLWSVQKQLRHTAELQRQEAQRQAELAALLDRASQAADTGKNAAASRHYQQVLTIDPHNAKALLFLAAIEQQNGRPEQARNLLAQVTERTGPLAATAKFLEGTLALAAHQIRSAEALLLEAHALRPDWNAPLRELVSVYALQLREPELRRTLAQLQALRPLTPRELATRLLAGQPLLETSQAITQLQAAIQADPADVQTAVALIRCCFHAGDDGRADELLDSFSTLEATSPELQALRALLQERAGQAQLSSAFILEIPLNAELASEAWEVALRQANRRQDFANAEQIAGYLARRHPLSTTASHACAQALERNGKHADAVRQTQITNHLDQLELLAYRMFRPQADIPQMAVPVMLEIAEHLQAIERSDESRDWLLAAQTLLPEDSQIIARLEQLKTEETKATLVQSIADLPTPSLPPLVVERLRSMTTVTAEEPTTANWDFQDVASEMGVSFVYHNGQSPGKRILETVGGGSAVLDLDGDLWPDLYFPQGQYAAVDPAKPSVTDSGTQSSAISPQLNDQVFRNQRGQRFQNVTAAAGLSEFSHSLAATVGDFDGDGFPDVFVANLGACRLFRNLGDGTFADETPASIEVNRNCSSGACFADLNADGLPEIFVLNYVEDWNRRCVNSSGEIATCDPRELQPAINRLYLNAGDGGFTDITKDAGLQDLPGRALGIIAADLNGDGGTELFVANDGMPNVLLTATPDVPAGVALRLHNLAPQAGVAIPQSGRSHAGMGVTVADFDSNGLPDLFVTNFYREQNTLYESIAPGLFLDASQRSGLGPASLAYLGFGTQALDVEGDGDADVVILNGDIDDYSSTGRPWKMPVTAFRNQGNGQFEELTGRCGADFSQPMLGRGLSLADFDGDGVSDLIAVRHDGPALLLRNRTAQLASGLSLRFAGRIGPRDGTGTTIRIRHADAQRHLWQPAGNGFSASNEPVIRISGLTESESLVAVQWGDRNFTLPTVQHKKDWVVREELPDGTTLLPIFK